MPETTWPDRICDPDSSRKRLWQPYRWRGWIVASNGQALVAIPDDGREIEDFPPPEAPFETDDAFGMLDTPVELGEPVDLEELRAWLPRPDEPCPACTDGTRPCSTCDGGWGGRCLECDGSGREMCPHCDGTRVLGRWEIVPVAMAGWDYNQRQLAVILDGAPGETVRFGTIYHPGSAAMRVMALEGEGWRAWLMPLRQGWDGRPEHVPALLERSEAAA